MLEKMSRSNIQPNGTKIIQLSQYQPLQHRINNKKLLTTVLQIKYGISKKAFAVIVKIRYIRNYHNCQKTV